MQREALMPQAASVARPAQAQSPGMAEPSGSPTAPELELATASCRGAPARAPAGAAELEDAGLGVAPGAGGAAGAWAGGVAVLGAAGPPPSSPSACRHPGDTLAMFFCKHVNTAGPRGTLEQ
jgi:hypothetical protein